MLAAAGGHHKVVKLLIRDGADPNLRKLSGVTALFLASAGGHSSVVTGLLESGADPNIKAT